jgi:hypothetical protein
MRAACIQSGPLAISRSVVAEQGYLNLIIMQRHFAGTSFEYQ